ncbi:hypothetical protein [Noviherbaspirillum sp.]|uniref:hypothetical protein n=1 Tax=Noviherbaspirillum sp. TaxID=1926288 RepID=UPI002FE06A85
MRWSIIASRSADVFALIMFLWLSHIAFMSLPAIMPPWPLFVLDEETAVLEGG